jgi:hypothetical protein
MGTVRRLGIGLALAFSFLGAACQSEYNTVLDPLEALAVS